MSRLNQLCDKCAFLTLMGAVFFMPFLMVPKNIFIILTIVLIAFSGNYREKFSIIIHNPYVKWFVLLFLLYIIAITYSTAPDAMAKKTAFKNLRMLYPLFLVPFLVDMKRKETLIVVFLLGEFASFLIALGAHVSIGFHDFLVRMHSVAPYQYAFTSHIIGGFIDAFAAYLCLTKLKVVEGKQRWFYVFILACVLVHLFVFNLGRTGYFLMLVAFGVYLLQLKNRKKVILSGSALVLIVLVVAFSSNNVASGFKRIFHSANSYSQGDSYTSTGLRLAYSEHSFELFKKRPLFGYGSGGYYQAYYEQARQKGWIDLRGKVISNINDVPDQQGQYFKILVDLGLLGFAFFAMWFISAFRHSFSLTDQYRELSHGFLVLVLFACGIDIVIYNNMPGDFIMIMSSILFAIKPSKSS